MPARELCHSWKRQGQTRRPEENTSRIIKVSDMGDCLEGLQKVEWRCSALQCADQLSSKIPKNIFNCAQAAEAVKKVIRNSLCLNDHNDDNDSIWHTVSYCHTVKAASVDSRAVHEFPRHFGYEDSRRNEMCETPGCEGLLWQFKHSQIPMITQRCRVPQVNSRVFPSLGLHSFLKNLDEFGFYY